MGSMSDQFEIDLLKCISGQSPAGVFGTNVLTTFYAAFTTLPTESSAGVEASFGGYARVAVTGTVAVPSAGAMPSNVIVNFPAKTDVGTVTIVGIGIMSALTSGTRMFQADLRDNAGNIITKDLGQNDVLSFSAGALTWTAD
jgi:hypothetical protein